MDKLSASEITVIILALGLLLASAKILGELFKRFRQPSVIGEILAGILLGPTILGTFAPDLSQWLFPQSGNVALVFDGLMTLAVVLFLLVAGMEVDLSRIWRQGRVALYVSLFGMVAPFALGFSVAWFMPHWLGVMSETRLLTFSLFFATTLTISALPVIAKTLMDLKLYYTDLGMIVIAAGIVNDLIGWIIFSVILGLIGSASHSLSVGMTVLLTLGFTAFMLTIGRWLIHRFLPWLQAHTSFPGGVLSFAFVLALFGAAFTEWIGIHAIFGSFLVGVAIGDSSHLREQTRTIINDFISSIFAPLFFASIGLKVNFFAHFDLLLCAIVLVIACSGKILGCYAGAKLSGMPVRESWAVGFAMNARGAMEIILGLLALQYGLIQENMFVALVVMALATSMMSGSAIQILLKRKKQRTLDQYLNSKSFVTALKSLNREDAIRELAQAAASGSKLKAATVEDAVLARETIMSTGLANRLAVPHARLSHISAPIVVVGLSKIGIDFNAPDGESARIIFLLLTPENDMSAQLELLRDIATLFQYAEVVEKAANVGSYTQFLAVLNEQRSKEAKH